MTLEFHVGDMFSVMATLTDKTLFAFTANHNIDRFGCLVMGAGMALEVKKRYPPVPSVLGAKYLRELKLGDNFTYTINGKECMDYGILNSGYMNICAFQTKRDWKRRSNKSLIANSFTKAVTYMLNQGYTHLHLNAPGIGHGGIDPRWLVAFLKHGMIDITGYVSTTIPKMSKNVNIHIWSTKPIA